MTQEEIAKVREEIKSILARLGHGSQGDFLKETGLKPATLYRFLSGNDVSIKNYEKISQGLARLRSKVSDYPNVESLDTRKANNRDLLRGFPEKEPTAIIASKLYAAADMLISKDFDTRDKVKDFSGLVTSLYERLDSIIDAFNKAGKSSEKIDIDR